ncbi:flagellar basal body protein FliL [Bordetella genomosp. 7]|uniref:Flagellar protein FliL n=1 Tax=Bordetella genomosp. 7 TaxID=1416805 RepID=A0A261RBJ0_9BORD|nr:flagellar basal body-associated FliL family protein [Bordetella genomosp. 7]OZI22355.1 flagellar basal body protein FliL [Bordetella genomosp. 7]OZI27059.1 flagellar basal body protein FliL [Bordetella genomosp. 7]
MATSKNPSMPARSSLPLRTTGGSSIMRGLFWLLALAIVASASVAVTWFIMQRQHADTLAQVRLGVGQPDAGSAPTPTVFVAPPAKPAQVPAPIFIPLEAFTVTLLNGDTERLLHVGITLRANDEQTRMRIEKYMPEVRSRILMVLSSQSPAAVQTLQGKADMARAIVNAVNQPFLPLPDGQHVSDALFTAFVVQ